MVSVGDTVEFPVSCGISKAGRSGSAANYLLLFNTGSGNSSKNSTHPPRCLQRSPRHRTSDALVPPRPVSGQTKG